MSGHEDWDPVNDDDIFILPDEDEILENAPSNLLLPKHSLSDRVALQQGRKIPLLRLAFLFCLMALVGVIVFKQYFPKTTGSDTAGIPPKPPKKPPINNNGTTVKPPPPLPVDYTKKQLDRFEKRFIEELSRGFERNGMVLK